MERLDSNSNITNPIADKHAAEYISPNSFMRSEGKNFKKSPPPKTIPYCEVKEMVPPNFKMEDRLKDFNMSKDGTLKIANKDLRDKQKAVIKKIFAKAAATILEGKNVIGMSLPINIFQERSTIERLLDLFRFFPYYCNLACEAENEIERIKFLAAALVGSCQYQMDQWKPFNPILGETFQGHFDENTEMSVEHTSHHPSISNFYMTGKGWKCYGALVYNAKIKANKVIAFTENWSTLEFDDGIVLKFTWPSLEMGNFIFGVRKMSMVRNIVVKSEKAKVKCLIRFNKEVKRRLMGLLSKWEYNVLEGSLYIYNPAKELAMKKKKWYDTMLGFNKMADSEMELEKVSGNWLKNLLFNKEEYWNANQEGISKRQIPLENCLPSSYRYREDLCWVHYNNEEFAQKWKIMLEVQQREDKKARAKGQSQRKKLEKSKKPKKGFFSMFRKSKKK